MSNSGSSSSFNSSTTTTTPNFDNLLLRSLMSRLQLRPHAPPPLSKSLEDILFSDLLLDSLSDSDSDSGNENTSNKTQLAREESKLEKEIIRTILSGEIEKLKPNSGQAISIGEHHICVGFQEEENGSEYRVWEWHGHIMLFDEENGYTPEYIYGNYFERVGAAKRKMNMKKKKKSDDDDDDEKEEKVVNEGGLKGLIGGGETGSGRILHRNVCANSGSPRLI